MPGRGNLCRLRVEKKVGSGESVFPSGLASSDFELNLEVIVVANCAALLLGEPRRLRLEAGGSWSDCRVGSHRLTRRTRSSYCFTS